MRFLLVGGTGFFGSALKLELERLGASVLTIARGRLSSTPPDYALDVVANGMELEHLLRSGDTVVYLVARSPLWRPLGGRKAYRQAHLSGAIQCLQAGGRAGIRRFVYVSALGVERGCGAAYAETKARTEAILRESSTPTSVIAPSILFDEESEIVQALELLCRFPWVPIPKIEVPFRPIHRRDAARIVAAALLQEKVPGRIELTGPEKLTFTEVAETYLLPRGIRVYPMPRLVSTLAIALLSRLKLPGLPSELRGMLSIDNAGAPPAVAGEMAEMTHFSDWALP